MNIELVDLRLVNSEKTKAFADVRMGAFIIRDFRVVKENGKRPYVKAPFTTYKDQAGHLKFRPIIILPDELRGEIDLIILNEYKRKMERENVQGRS